MVFNNHVLEMCELGNNSMMNSPCRQHLFELYDFERCYLLNFMQCYGMGIIWYRRRRIYNTNNKMSIANLKF